MNPCVFCLSTQILLLKTAKNLKGEQTGEQKNTEILLTSFAGT